MKSFKAETQLIAPQPRLLPYQTEVLVQAGRIIDLARVMDETDDIKIGTTDGGQWQGKVSNGNSDVSFSLGVHVAGGLIE